MACLHLSSFDHNSQINKGMNKIVTVESLSNLQKMLMLEVGEVGALSSISTFSTQPETTRLLYEAH